MSEGLKILATLFPPKEKKNKKTSHEGCSPGFLETSYSIQRERGQFRGYRGNIGHSPKISARSHIANHQISTPNLSLGRPIWLLIAQSGNPGDEGTGNKLITEMRSAIHAGKVHLEKKRVGKDEREGAGAFLVPLLLCAFVEEGSLTKSSLLLT